MRNTNGGMSCGKFFIKVADVTHIGKAGERVFRAGMVCHSLGKIGPGEDKVLMFFQPAGKMEEMFNKIAAGVTKGM